MKPVDIKNNKYIDCNMEVNDKCPKYKVGDHIWISKYKNIFGKEYTPNWSEEVFVIKKVENTVLGHMLLMIFERKKFLEYFIKKNYKRLISKNSGQKK